MSSLLETENVVKRFGSLRAVDEVSIEVEEGDQMGLIGPNGAGKTTLFNVISGFMEPEEGKVFFKGKDVTGIAPWKLSRKGLTRTFQILNIFPELTVEDNIKAVNIGESGDRPDEELISELVDLLDLERDAVSKNLSMGEKKKLTIGIGMATRSDLLMLDEPFAGLRVGEIEQVSNALRTLRQEANVTQLIVDHRIKDLLKHVEKVIVLNTGEIIARGTPTEIRNDEKVRKTYFGV